MPLRLVLGLTFLWAGWGKLEATFPAKGEDAARLANMGLIVPVPGGGPAPSAAPAAPLPSNTPDSAPTPKPAGGPEALVSLAQTPLAVGAGPTYRAADFPSEQPVRRLWGIALRVSKAGDPPVDASGKRPQATWPSILATPLWAKTQAQAVLVTELLAGAFVLLGFVTRWSSLALGGVMLGAIWLDQLTPAMQSGATIWGVLPAHAPFDVRAWTPLAWQCALLAAALSLAISGAGRLSVDLALSARARVAPAPTTGARSAGRPT